MSESLELPRPTNNADLNEEIPALTLPTVQWIQPKPFYINVNVEEPDLEEDVPLGQPKYPPFFPIITEIGTPIYNEEDEYIGREVTTKLHLVQGYVHVYEPIEDGSKMKSIPVANMPSETSKIDITDGTKCWVIATEDSSGALVNPVFGHGEDWPDDLAPPEENTIRFTGNRVWKICEIVDIAEEDQPPNLTAIMHRTGIIEHISVSALSTGGLMHPFKVTSVGPQLSEVEPFEPVPDVWVYNVYTGTAGGIVIPTTVPDLIVTDQYLIYVKFTRDVYSRVITEAVLEFGSIFPASDNLNQYVLIAQVELGNVIQHRFEDIRISEFLISEAGELKLISVFDTTNSYTLP